jgi:L-lactate dehydrogenase complex protein LldE
MKIGLFIPCYINEFYPEVAVATLKILENLGYEVEYPLEQTCCGQIQANNGFIEEAKELAYRFVGIFKKYDYIVAPSGSCVAMVRENYAKFMDSKEYEHIRKNTYELIEFLHDVAKPKKLNAKFYKKVSIHNSCHAHRELGLASMSEKNTPSYSKIKDLLSLVEGIEIFEPSRKDECCGFGGTFSISEEALSIAMGKDKIQDHIQTGAEYITGVDSSCLMHMQGIIDREKLNIQTIHIAQILAAEEE